MVARLPVARNDFAAAWHCLNALGVRVGLVLDTEGWGLHGPPGGVKLAILGFAAEGLCSLLDAEAALVEVPRDAEVPIEAFLEAIWVIHRLVDRFGDDAKPVLARVGMFVAA